MNATKPDHLANNPAAPITLRSPAAQALSVARWALLALTAATMLIYAYGALRYHGHATLLPADVLPNANWTAQRMASVLASIGWTASGYAVFTLALSSLSAACFATVACLILWRRGDDWFTLLLPFELVYIGVFTNPVATFAIADVIPWLQPAAAASAWLLWPGFFILFYVFPDGRFASRWMGWCALGWALIGMMGTVLRDGFPPLLVVPLVITALVSPIYRYKRRMDALQRQQTKIVVAAIAFMLLVLPAQIVILAVFGDSGADIDTLVWFLVNSGLSSAWALLPIAIAVAVLRYRLWDIDVIIRRTVTYAIVSAALAIVYFGANLVAQSIIGALGGQRNEVAIVASTLAVAALFSPVRRRVQNAIDRRFNRQRYDADKVVADFAEYAAHETDLNALQARIVGVLAETIQPRQVSLWVKQPTEGGPRAAERHSAF